MKASVLVVEDETVLHDLYKLILETHGFKVISVATNGQEAIDEYKKLFKSDNKPDFIIMDHRMPIKNGIEATREIMELDPKAKIIFATADMFTSEKAKDLNIIVFLPKPFTMEKLIQILNENL